jgi:hypothetical protein
MTYEERRTARDPKIWSSFVFHHSAYGRSIGTIFKTECLMLAVVIAKIQEGFRGSLETSTSIEVHWFSCFPCHGIKNSPRNTLALEFFL